VNGSEFIQGRRIGPEELAEVRELLATQPGWSRWRLSRELARLWDWRTACGYFEARFKRLFHAAASNDSGRLDVLPAPPMRAYA
jgi:hypothetical protein